MSSTSFWQPPYQLFSPDEPLTQAKDLRDFYVQRANSPMENLIDELELEDKPAKFLLAGHRGSGKTTELRLLQTKLNDSYTVIWINTETALERFNIGYAEVVVLIGQEICRQAIQPDWWSRNDERLLRSLVDSLKTVVYKDKEEEVKGLELPELLRKIGLCLKQGLTIETHKQIEIKINLSEVLKRVNDIINAAEKDRKQKLLILVDGLDRHELKTATEMFSSSLLTDLDCHIIYSIPISLRYSPSFRQAMQNFRCLDLTNPPVFECDTNSCPTTNPHQLGRGTLLKVINKRLVQLGDSYKGLFNPEALEIICENSGGVIRDLIRLTRTTCLVAKRRNLIYVDLDAAKEAVHEERKLYTLSDYHFSVMNHVHTTGQLTTETHNLPSKGDFVICDELLQNKFVLGYYDANQTWFDVNPILLEDLHRWQADRSLQNR